MATSSTPTAAEYPPRKRDFPDLPPSLRLASMLAWLLAGLKLWQSVPRLLSGGSSGLASALLGIVAALFLFVAGMRLREQRRVAIALLVGAFLAAFAVSALRSGGYATMPLVPLLLIAIAVANWRRLT